jgi:hypothetical protein
VGSISLASTVSDVTVITVTPFTASMSTLINPFNFETPADRWSFTDREELLPRILAVLTRPKQRALVHGRRRVGKTSLIKHAALAAKRPFAFVDLSTANDLSEVARKLVGSFQVDEKLGTKLMALLRKYVERVSLKGGQFALGADLRAPGQKTLENALAFLDEYAFTSDQCLTICMDEFQDLRRLGGDRAEWSLRGMIQHHERLSYVFSGSDHRLFQWMTEPNAAFFKQLELIEVGPIDPGLMARWIDSRSHRGGLQGSAFGAEVVAAAGPCTGDIVRLAKQVFDQAAVGRKGDVVRQAFDAVALEYLTPEFGTIWRPLPPSQRMLLRAIANEQPRFAKATLEMYGLTSGTVLTAQTALFDKQILTMANEQVVFDSPFFRRWVQATGEPIS